MIILNQSWELVECRRGQISVGVVGSGKLEGGFGYLKLEMKNNSNTLRNFEIKQKLGSGSYGVIFKAINKVDKSTCVLKQINLARMSERAKMNAVNEATIMGKLRHPFIVSYCDSFTEDRNLNIIMEFCDGGDLSYFLKQQNKKYLKEEKIWRFFIQICLGLEHIHRNKILHRDIKTLNIFLHKNEAVKIGDLGVAKMLNSNDFAHTMVGTPFYLSPELCEEKPYNEKSDIWAMGCLLYELCTFRHPFEAANQASLILKIIRGKYPPIPQFYSAHLKEMIDWCLERDYKRRPTAQMILSKAHVKQMVEEFEFHKIIEEFARKNTENVLNPPRSMEINQKKTVPLKPEEKAKAPENIRPALPSSHLKQRKALDAPVPVPVPIPNIPRAPEAQPVKVTSKEKQSQKKPIEVKAQIKRDSHNKWDSQEKKDIQGKRQSQKRSKDDEDSRPKVLFGGQNKAQFVQALNVKMEKEVEKKPSLFFEIPWNNPHPKTQMERYKVEDKIVIHNKDILFGKDLPAPPPKYPEPVQRIKMEKKVEAKVYEVKQPERAKGIIKSGGFVNAGPSNRKKSESDAKKSNEKQPTERKESQPNAQSRVAANSMRNLRKEPEERQHYLAHRRDSKPVAVPQYPPRSKKNIPSEHRPPKHLPHGKTDSISRYSEVTKEEEDLVANLPDIVNTHAESDSEEDLMENRSNKFQLNQIDHDIVLRKYEEMIESAKNISPHQQDRQSGDIDESNQPNKGRDHEDANGQNNMEEEWEMYQSEALNEEVEEQLEAEAGQNDEQELQETGEMRQSDGLYEVNRFNMGGSEQHEWSFDEEPELPMMEETETPFFEEANPYLVDGRTEEESLEGKKQHLQTKLKENLKREDEINKLMQLKIEECKSVVPKGFEEILAFFRSKINMDREYTDEDEREVEQFLSKRNLTDQRKFQNIYKIMHFEMELENTRTIIQSICKKLNELIDN